MLYDVLFQMNPIITIITQRPYRLKLRRYAKNAMLYAAEKLPFERLTVALRSRLGQTSCTSTTSGTVSKTSASLNELPGMDEFIIFISNQWANVSCFLLIHVIDKTCDFPITVALFLEVAYDSQSKCLNSFRCTVITKLKFISVYLHFKHEGKLC